MSSKFLTLMNMNHAVKEAKYSIGRINSCVSDIMDNIKEGKQKYDFEEIVRADIGNGQDPDHAPITFARQVLALVSLPSLMNDPMFLPDVKSHAEALLKDCRGGSIGSYTEVIGIELIRKHVAEFIERRDGYSCDFEDIVLSSGSCDLIKFVLELFIVDNDGKPSGVMTPIPGQPLYSWTIAEHRMKQIDYFLNEDNKSWSINCEELQRAVDEAKQYCCPRVLIVNNPGNPTCQILTKQNIEEIIKFSYREKLFIFADEIYQNNIYSTEKSFISFKKVLSDLGPPYNAMQLASLMSSSKGYFGESGARGAYVELLNVDSDVKYMLLKLMSSVTCPSSTGQMILDCVVNPPRYGDPSYELFTLEKSKILNSHISKAQLITESFKRIEGMTCFPVEGAPYIFVKVDMPPKVVEEAKRRNVCPSEIYTTELLKTTGICVSPGSIFGQKPGNYFFRMSILLPMKNLKFIAEEIKKFHESFLMKYKESS